MNVRELDRLVSKTDLTPTSKLMLRTVRRSVMRGKVRAPARIGRYNWTVIVEGFGGQGAKFTFSLKRTANGDT